MDKLGLFRNLMILAAADGKLTEEEVTFLALRSARWEIDDADFRATLAAARDPSARFEFPPGPAQRRELLGDMLRMMAVDGELADIERRLFAAASVAMGFGNQELDQIIDDVVGKKKKK